MVDQVLMKRIILCVILFVLTMTESANPNDVIGIWETDISFSLGNCQKKVLEIDENFFFIYDYDSGLLVTDICLLPEMDIGTYMISNTSILVRFANKGVSDSAIRLYQYNMTDSNQLVLTNEYSKETHIFVKRPEIALDGDWSTTVSTNVLLTLTKTYGRSMIRSGLVYTMLDTFQTSISVVNDWVFNSGVGTFNLYGLFQVDDITDIFGTSLATSKIVTGNSGDYSFSNLALQTVAWTDIFVGEDEISGNYISRNGSCNRILKLENGFYREAITGNRAHCKTPGFVTGYYNIDSDTELTLKSANFFNILDVFSGTLSYEKTNDTIKIGDIVYTKSAQIVKSFRREVVQQNSTSENILEFLVGTALNLFGVTDPNNYDILRTGFELKRSQQESQIIIHEDEAGNEEPDEVIQEETKQPPITPPPPTATATEPEATKEMPIVVVDPNDSDSESDGDDSGNTSVNINSEQIINTNTNSGDNALDVLIFVGVAVVLVGVAVAGVVIYMNHYAATTA